MKKTTTKKNYQSILNRDFLPSFSLLNARPCIIQKTRDLGVVDYWMMREGGREEDEQNHSFASMMSNNRLGGNTI